MSIEFEYGIPFSHAGGIAHIQETIGRGSATFALSKTDARFGQPKGSFSLSVGSTKHIRIPDGTIVSIGLNAEQVRALRDWCNALLGAES